MHHVGKSMVSLWVHGVLPLTRDLGPSFTMKVHIPIQIDFGRRGLCRTAMVQSLRTLGNLCSVTAGGELSQLLIPLLYNAFKNVSGQVFRGHNCVSMYRADSQGREYCSQTGAASPNPVHFCPCDVWSMTTHALTGTNSTKQLPGDLSMPNYATI
jgi:hypothetical protein